ncbi:MAG: hypothetical protein J4473_00200 [Candidatus Aenigmarchaeota archaeon]|nr:hypothetical protein [Candidatus Aenigmarchaeota archaeon]
MIFIKINQIEQGKPVLVLARVLTEKTRLLKSGSTVQNILLADDTGSIRLVLWNDEIDKYGIKEGETIGIKGYCKKDSVEIKFISLGPYGGIERSDKEIKNIMTISRKSIEELNLGDKAEIRAAFVQVFESRHFYRACSECGLKLENDECPEHGSQNGAYNMVLNGITDDGTGNIRIVFFKDVAEKLTGRNVDENMKLFLEDRNKFYSAMPVGVEFIFRGVCQYNNFLKRNEFLVNEIKPVDVNKEIKALTTSNFNV